MKTENQHNPLGDAAGMEARLWDYIDGLKADEQPVIEALIAENGQWQAKYQELLEVHSLMKEVELDHPSIRFTKNVMEGITKYKIAPATKKYINQKIIWGLAAFFIAMIVGFIIYGISQVNWTEGNTAKNIINIDFTEVDYSKVFNNSYINIFMMLNIVLALMLLDRYLSNKRKGFQKEF